MSLGNRGLVGKPLSHNTFPQKKKSVEETQHAPKKCKEPQEKKNKKDKTTPPSSRAVSQHEKVGSSSTINKTSKISESKGKNKFVEETSTVAVEKEGHQTKMKKKRNHVSIPDLVPPCKRTTRIMARKGKTIVSPHTLEYPIDLTSPFEDLPVQDDIPSLTEEKTTITLCGMREEVE
jgi:hypothetical protein